MPDAENKLEETKAMIDRIKSKWAQFEMDGTRNVWIVKPGAKSRGRGKALLVSLESVTVKSIMVLMMSFRNNVNSQ